MASDLVNFVILFQGRAGSSYLIDVLDRHPEITAAGEWLAGVLEEDVGGGDGLWSRVRAAQRRFRKGCPAQRQLDGTRAFFGRHRPSTRVAGFKTKVRDLRDPGRIGEVLEAVEARAIVMRRRNLVKQTVSRLNAARLHRETERWNLLEGEAPLGTFSVAPEVFAAKLRRVVYDQRVLDAYSELLDLPKLQVEYEDLLRDRYAWFQSIFGFLQTESRPIESQVLKNTDDDLSCVLTNFEELRKAYCGTRFEPMFDETVGG